MRVEHSRKHGPFDPRFPSVGHESSPESRPFGEKGLDWQRFASRFFPGSGRHRSGALVAYSAYLTAETEESREEEQAPLAMTPDTERWEGEGGAAAGRRRKSRVSA